MAPQSSVLSAHEASSQLNRPLQYSRVDQSATLGAAHYICMCHLIPRRITIACNNADRNISRPIPLISLWGCVYTEYLL